MKAAFRPRLVEVAQAKTRFEPSIEPIVELQPNLFQAAFDKYIYVRRKQVNLFAQQRTLAALQDRVERAKQTAIGSLHRYRCRILFQDQLVAEHDLIEVQLVQRATNHLRFRYR